jgi:hypothetical protein
MSIATLSKRLITAPAEPNVAAVWVHRAPLKRDPGMGGDYRHLVPPGPKQYLSNPLLPR